MPSHHERGDPVKSVGRRGAPRFVRHRRLIGGDAQRRLVLLAFIGGAVALLVQTALLGWMLQGSLETTEGTESTRAELPRLLAVTALATFALVVPATCFLVLAASSRVFGPLYRFRTFLRDVVEGRETAPCRLRETDAMQDVCELLNAVSESSRARNREAEERRDATGVHRRAA